MYVKGVSATTLDEVWAASGTSKSQLYQHFPDKDTLTQAVLALQAQRVLERETGALARVNSLSGLRRWRNALGLRRMQQGGRLGSEADPDQLAIGVMAALQGGYLLAQTAHDVRPMAIALDMALAHIQTLATA
jgi:TetR/AcrR family transcriptional repressor of nem operon